MSGVKRIGMSDNILEGYSGLRRAPSVCLTIYLLKQNSFISRHIGSGEAAGKPFSRPLCFLGPTSTFLIDIDLTASSPSNNLKCELNTVFTCRKFTRRPDRIAQFNLCQNSHDSRMISAYIRIVNCKLGFQCTYIALWILA